MNGEQQPKRSIDERLDALSANTEFMSHMLKDVMAGLDSVKQDVRMLAEAQKQTDRQIRRLGSYIRVLAETVLDHETRLRLLESDEHGDQEH